MNSIFISTQGKNPKEHSRYTEQPETPVKLKYVSIPALLLPLCQGLLSIVVIDCFAQTENLFSSTRQILILISNITLLLLHLIIFLLLERESGRSGRRKIKDLTAIVSRIICSIFLTFTFLEGQIALRDALRERSDFTHSFQIRSQLTCLFYSLSLHLNFYYSGKLKYKIWARTIFLGLWLFHETFLQMREDKNSFDVTFLYNFLLFIIILIVYGFHQIREEQEHTINEKLFCAIVDRLSLNIIVLDKSKQVLFSNQAANSTFGLNKWNEEGIIKILLGLRIRSYVPSKDLKCNDPKNFKKERNANGKRIIKRTVLAQNTIDELLNRAISEAGISNETYFSEISTSESSGKTHAINFIRNSSKKTETEEGPLVDDFNSFETPLTKTIFRVKVLYINLDAFASNPFYILSFENMQEAREIFEQSEGENVKKNLLKSFSHEMHTALNGSISMIDCAIDDPSVTKDLKDKYLCQTQICLKTLKYFINDVIDYLKLETHELVLEKEMVDTKEVLREVDSLMRDKCKAKGLTFSTFNLNEDDNFLYTDPLKLKQVLINLLSTSLKYTSVGEVRLEVRESLKHMDCLEFEIEDSRFWNNRNSPEQKLHTVLSEEDVEFRAFMAKKLARFLNPEGRIRECIRTECRAEKGVSYTFLLAKHVSDERLNFVSNRVFQTLSLGSKVFRSSAPKSKSENDWRNYSESNSHILDEKDEVSVPNNIPISNFRVRSLCSINNLQIQANHFQNKSRKKGVLIVDDDPFNILSMELILKREDYLCFKAYNGLEALDFLQKFYSQPRSEDSAGLDLIFMDLNMPLMDGLASARAINSLILQKVIPFLPIICCSANDTKSDLDSCESAGMSGFISKPLTISKVRHVMKSLFKE